MSQGHQPTFCQRKYDGSSESAYSLRKVCYSSVTCPSSALFPHTHIVPLSYVQWPYCLIYGWRIKVKRHEFFSLPFALGHIFLFIFYPFSVPRLFLVSGLSTSFIPICPGPYPLRDQLFLYILFSLCWLFYIAFRKAHISFVQKTSLAVLLKGFLIPFIDKRI